MVRGEAILLLLLTQRDYNGLFHGILSLNSAPWEDNKERERGECISVCTYDIARNSHKDHQPHLGTYTAAIPLPPLPSNDTNMQHTEKVVDSQQQRCEQRFP